jgi:ABC-type Mn2+/Zn2+ transport system permease subunit
VTPAATAQLVSNSFGRLVAVAGAIGVVCPIIGLYISYWVNSASGATIVLVETAVFTAVLVVTSLVGRYRHAEAGARAAQAGSAR